MRRDDRGVADRDEASAHGEAERTQLSVNTFMTLGGVFPPRFAATIAWQSVAATTAAEIVGHGRVPGESVAATIAGQSVAATTAAEIAGRGRVPDIVPQRRTKGCSCTD